MIGKVPDGSGTDDVVEPVVVREVDGEVKRDLLGRATGEHGAVVGRGEAVGDVLKARDEPPPPPAVA